MRRHSLILSLAVTLLFGVAALAGGAETGPETNKLRVKVGPFFIKESDKKIELQGPGPHVLRKGKRVNITVTVENFGREKSEPVKLKYVESGSKSEPRYYRIEAIEPGKKWERTFMARYDESGRKSVTATLTTVEDKPLTDAKGAPRPDATNTGSINLTVKEM
jgi:hypothetical protein